MSNEPRSIHDEGAVADGANVVDEASAAEETAAAFDFQSFIAVTPERQETLRAELDAKGGKAISEALTAMTRLEVDRGIEFFSLVEGMDNGLLANIIALTLIERAERTMRMSQDTLGENLGLGDSDEHQVGDDLKLAGELIDYKKQLKTDKTA